MELRTKDDSSFGCVLESKYYLHLHGSGESNTLAHDKSTLESEKGADFFSAENVVSDSTAIEELLDYYYYSDDESDATKYQLKEVEDFVWDGWDAALIVSKRKMAFQVDTRDYYAIKVPKIQDITGGTALEEYEIHLGKRSARQTLETEGRGIATRIVSRWLHRYQVVHNVSWSGPIKEGQYNMIGKAVVALTVRTMPHVDLNALKELLPNTTFNSVRESMFDSVAKFILSVFDTEDFERIYYLSAVKDEYSKFCANLDYFDCDPLEAVAEGRVEVDQFSTLREHDLCDVIRQYQGRDKKYFEVHPWAFPPFPDEWMDFKPEDIVSAMKAFRNWVPLKEDCKMQLTLELTRGKCFCILDTLILEALNGVNIQELLGNLPKSHPLFCAEHINCVGKYFADGIMNGFYSLADMKAAALHHFYEAVIFPISGGCFGPCTDEVTEVIKIAEHERRMQGDHFISVQHILFGLSLSRVGECVESILSKRGLLPSKLSTFSIYKLSRFAATNLHDKVVGLEHLVLAIFFGKQENITAERHICLATWDRSSLFFDEKDKWDDELLNSLRNCDTQCGVESFDDSDAFGSLLPEHCFNRGRVKPCGIFLVETLQKSLKSGLKLKDIHV